MTTSAALARDLDDPVEDRASAFVGERRTRVEGLVLLCRIGIHAQERLAPQRVRVDVELAAAEDRVPDDIDAVICYERLVEQIRQIAQADHINLVETLAARIADHCCSALAVDRVRVGVRKLDAIAEVDAVGVELERRRRPERVLRPS
jgi:7,8-dihydroneopterin aldolase/epimerase/oxygenase